ncbi:uncharacterized protein LOC125063957 [Vanessa atalanta]|uniref:uncharacterized protein LOC125063957 n=1 Tax=Vanessa atalanta TaxID=42275 RepID=UPI001FCD9CFD|nr:uncharacterized protein LOC125063957 [Vanessa atalanta]XP_047526647.1 uncharacterized protein LOC125063957 [Vanessa atalanta]XP_047526648.1 uncharacterized protein LOC125063957 [Vanessa atalanta]
MDVKSSEWQGKAVDNITKYLHRGGECQGDVPQLIGGPDLLNTIGIAMGLPTSDPETWTKSELEKALRGELVFYEGKAREAIDVVADQIRSCCGGDDKNFVTVLPIEIYHESKLYEVPLFRVKRYKDSKNYYIDNIGRCYGSFSDWFEFNKLPPGKMAYPYKLILAPLSGSKRANVYVANTPCSRIEAKTARGLDTVAAVAGLGSSVALLFVTGGLAAPLVGTALVTAGYGTTRAGYQLAEKAVHGENINPFTNSESRMLWLGIAANLTSFGAMGASMRLTSLAARGRNISDAFRMVADIANGTNVAVSGIAILNTTIFMINNHKDLSAVDILMHGASIAFWTKGVFCYKSANTIIKESENYAFSHLSKDLSPEQAAELAAIRNRVQNDGQLLKKFHAAMASNISAKDYSQILIDGMKYYDTVATLSPDQIEAFNSIRNYVRDDIHLITGLTRISNHNGWTPSETIELVLNMWQKSTQTNAPSGTNAILREGNIILGRAPPIKIDQLPKLSPPMMRFLGEHLSQIDVAASRQWSSSVPVLLNLQAQGMFTICPVTKVFNSGRAVIFLNNQLEVSIYKLNTIPKEDRLKVFEMISRLSPSVSSSQLPSELMRICVRDHRLRFYCQRNESIKLTEKYVEKYPALRRIVQADLLSHEKDRLYTFVSEVSRYKVDIYMDDMMKFVCEMKPKNISELVAYCEFAITCVEDEMLLINDQIKKKQIIPPRNTKLSVWTRKEASAKVFKDGQTLIKKFRDTLKIVTDNDMAGVVTLAEGLSDDALVAAIRNTTVRFGSPVSAAYHILKHPTAPLEAHVARANQTLAPPSRAAVSVGQDGDVRSVHFEGDGGKCFLLERGGRVFLCSYVPKSRE